MTARRSRRRGDRTAGHPHRPQLVRRVSGSRAGSGSLACRQAPLPPPDTLKSECAVNCWNRSLRPAPGLRTQSPAICPELSKTPARCGASLNRFNNLTPFTPGKTGQTLPSAAKTGPFASNSGQQSPIVSQPGTALAAPWAKFVRRLAGRRSCVAFAANQSGLGHGFACSVTLPQRRKRLSPCG